MTGNEGLPDIPAMMGAIRHRLGMADGSAPATATGVDDVMRRIKAELSRRGGVGAAGRVGFGACEATSLERWQPSAPRLSVKREYVLGELLALADLDFVENAYRVVLRRPADDEGRQYHLDQLRQGGMSKVEILGRLRWSAEGLARGVHIDGLLLPYKLAQWRRLPMVGPMLGWLHALVRLPRLLDRQTQLESSQSRESQEIGRLLNRVSSQLELQLADVSAELARRADVDAVQALRSNLDLLRADSENRAVTVAKLSAEVEGIGAALEEVLARLREERALGVVLRSEFEQHRTDAAHRDDLRKLRTELEEADVTRTESLLAMRNALDESQQSLRGALDVHQRQLQEIAERENEAAALAASLDPLYAQFEDRFRGSNEMIRQRMRPYLDLVVQVASAVPDSSVIDLGAGRGEWLDLLREKGVAARGVDTNQVFLAACRKRGLDMIDADAVAALADMPDHSASAITSMHLVEHLPFEQLVRLLDECRRVLREGGILILETPNPENLEVASHWFYLDPTHRNPLPPGMLSWLVEQRGFHNVAVERLTEARGFNPAPQVPTDVPGADPLNSLLDHYRAAPDYAVIAWR